MTGVRAFGIEITRDDSGRPVAARPVPSVLDWPSVDAADLDRVALQAENFARLARELAQKG